MITLKYAANLTREIFFELDSEFHDDGSASDSFLVKNRTKQGCVMALILFDIYFFYFEEVCLRLL